MIIYKNLGAEAQAAFSQTWGVSYALDNCSEWQDVLIGVQARASQACELFDTPRAEASKVALILIVLDVLHITKDRQWFEARGLTCAFVAFCPFLRPAVCLAQEHIDFVSIQAMLFNGAARSWWQQTRVLVRYQTRMTDD